MQFAEANQIATKGQMVFFDQSGGAINLTSISSSGSYLVLAGKSLNEPIARHGPFVANTEGEIKQAMLDYQSGKMGQLWDLQLLKNCSCQESISTSKINKDSSTQDYWVTKLFCLWILFLSTTLCLYFFYKWI